MNLPKPPVQSYKALLWDYDFLLARSDDECCYSLSDREVQILLTIVDYVAWRTRYRPTDTTIDQETILRWQGNLARKLMSGCCPGNQLTRYTDDGVLEASEDGGVTWTPAPELDPRVTGAYFPPMPGPDGNDKKCLAATSAMEYVKQNLIDVLEDGMGYAAIYDVLIALVGFLGLLGGIGILVAILVGALFSAGIVAVQAAFTAGVWDDFKCILYCRIRSDGSFSNAGWQGVKADIATQFSGVVELVLFNWVNTVGVIGLTNSARSGMAVTADCVACDCPPGCVDETWIIDGTFVTSDDDSITIDSILDPLGSGQQIVRYGTLDTADPLYCCHGCNFEVLAGAYTSSAFVHCNGVYDPISSFSDVDFRRLDIASSVSTFTVKINFNPDGCP